VEAWLDEFQVRYERDVQIGDYFADYLLRDLDLIVEVDGRTWHTNHPLHGQDRVAHDKRKDEALTCKGYTVLRLPEHAIRHGSAKDDLDRAITRQVLHV
jgi:very-short-patch-repair endonuclease